MARATDVTFSAVPKNGELTSRRMSPVSATSSEISLAIWAIVQSSVAMISASFWNKTWGLPLYYGGQLILASTVSP